MEPKQDVLTSTSTWSQLEHLAEKEKSTHVADLFATNKERFEQFSLNDCQILADFSKQRMTPAARDLLVKLAEEKTVSLEQLSLEDMQSVSPEITESVFGVLSVEDALKSRDSFGGTAPGRVLEAVAEARKRFLG